MEYISIVITVLGFLITFGGLSRKMVTKDDLEKLINRVDLLERESTEVEKDIAVIKYRLDHEREVE